MSSLLRRVQEAVAHCPLTETEILRDVVHPLDTDAYFLGQGTYCLYRALGMVFRPETILEIGVRFGYSLKSLSAGSERVRTIYGFDNEYDLPGSLALAARNLASLGADVHLALLDTQAEYDLPVPERVDLAHVDGWHTEQGCYHDCQLVLPHLRKGGILVVDDARGEVREGADRFCREHGLVPVLLPCFTDMYLIEI